jgi:hypothetical protein
MVGFTPDRDYRYLEVNRFLRQLHPEIVARTEAEIGAIVASETDVLFLPVIGATADRLAAGLCISVGAGSAPTAAPYFHRLTY